MDKMKYEKPTILDDHKWILFVCHNCVTQIRQYYSLVYLNIEQVHDLTKPTMFGKSTIITQCCQLKSCRHLDPL